jgi:hypothetical protein
VLPGLPDTIVKSPSVRAVLPDVGAQDGNVRDVSREPEVHLVAAEVPELLLGSVDEADVVELLVDDQPRPGAAVEVGDRTGEVCAFLLLAGALEIRALRLPQALNFRDAHAGSYVRVQLGRHVTRAALDLHAEAPARQLVAHCLRREALLDEVIGAALTLLGQRRRANAVEGDVVVRENEPVGRREGAGAAAAPREDANGRVLQPLDVLRRQADAVLLRDRVERELIEPPHALIGRQRRGREGGEQACDDAGLHRSTPVLRTPWQKM